MESIEERIKQARREYQRAWKEEHKEEVNAYARKWRKDNRDKVKGYEATYWEKKAKEQTNNNEG